MPPEANRNPSTPGAVAVSLSPRDLLKIVRGFSCFFWGLPIGLLLFSGALTIHVMPGLRVPAYVFAVFIIYCGVLLLQRAGPLSEMWRRRLHAALVLLLVDVYLAPFVYWWRNMPYQPYYTLNVVLLIVCTTWLLYIMNQLGAELGSMLNDSTFNVEAQVCAWISVVFMLIPALNAVILSVTLRKYPNGLIYFDERLAPFTMPRWLSVLALLPFTLTMAIVWRSKARCLRRLLVLAPPGRQADEVPS